MINIPGVFTKTAMQAITHAQISSAITGHARMGTGNLLLGLCQVGDELTRFLLSDIPYNKIYQTVYAHIGHGEVGLARVTDFSAHAQRILARTAAYANSEQSKLADVPHLWQEMLYEEGCTALVVLEELGKTPESLRAALEERVGVIERPQKAESIPASDAPLARIVVEVTPKGQSTEEKKAAPGKALETYARCLTAEAEEGRLEPLIGRKAELSSMIRVLGKKMKNNPLLIGEPGVGKSALAEGLAQAVVSENVPDEMRGAKIYALDLAQMVAGTKFRGEFEERMKAVIQEAESQERTVLFIDEVHSLVGAGDSQGSMDAANILKPALARGKLRVIGATTYKEYHKYIEKDAALARRFQRIDVREPDIAQSLTILHGLRGRYETYHHVKISDEALTAAVELSSRYVTDRFMPDKAIDLMDEAASMVRMEGWQRDAESETPSEPIIGRQEIARVVSEWTNVPVARIGQSEQSDVLQLEEALAKRLVGQREAIATIAGAIRRSRAGLGDPTRPIGVFMLLGLSGIGKTELCKALSEAMFGSEEALIRIDMSEYSEEASVTRLVGSPPGYVGFEEGGQLTDAVIKRPYSVILFDEIEKAHPKVYNLLLQLLDEGQLTDNVGRKVNFRNTVVMMTSNTGVSFDMDRRLGFALSEDATANRSKTIMEQAKRVFRPEFLGRIDEIVVMNSLTESDGIRIAENMLRQLSVQLLRLGKTLRWNESVLSVLAKAGVDQMSGARNLRRTIQKLVEDPMSDLLLTGGCSDEIVLDAQGEEIRVLSSPKALPESGAFEA